MDREEMFKVLQTCIIGESFRACGVGYDAEEGLEPYHASEFLDNFDEDDINGSFHSPEHFLESLCSSNAGRIYNTIREMENCWKTKSSMCSTPTMKLLWDLGNPEAMQYIDDMHGEAVAEDFFEHGCSIFGEL
jgi:hypothetical protein